MIINNFLFLKHELSKKKKIPTFFLNNKLFFIFSGKGKRVFFVFGVTHYIIT